MHYRRLTLIGALLASAMALPFFLHFVTGPSAQVATTVDEGKGDRKGKTETGRGKRAERAVAVEAATARGARTTTDIRAIGSLRSDESVQIASEIAGRIEQINFTEGGTVAAGDVLVKLDDALAEAEVADAKARFDLAEANNERAKKLSATGNVTEKAIDEADATLRDRARRAGAGARAAVQAHHQGAVLRRRRPAQGVAGRFIAVGTAIVNLEKIDVLKVDFKLPELFLPSVGVGQTVDVIGRCASGPDLHRRDLCHRSAGRRQRPRAGAAGAPAECGHGSAARPVRQGARQGQADARGRAGAGERHRAARRRDVRVPHRERQGRSRPR